MPRRRTTLLAAAALTAGLAATAPLTTAPAHAQRVPDARAAHRAAAPTLTVDLATHTRRISPLVYGVNSAEPAFAKAMRLPVDRWGGDTTETYNWRIRGANAAVHYYFQNFADCWSEAFDYCTTGHGYSAAEAQIARDRRTRTATLLTLPAMGWVANRVAYTNTNPCSFPRSAYVFMQICGKFSRERKKQHALGYHVFTTRYHSKGRYISRKF